VLRALPDATPAAELHGGLPQGERSTNLAKFATGEVSLLLCTDVAARGLDVDGVKVILNFDFPKTVETYVHRVGRTARAGRSGLAVTIVGAGRRAVLKDFLRARQADLDADPDASAAAVRSRTVGSGLLRRLRESIAAAEPRIAELETEDRLAQEQLRAEEQTDRMLNLLTHADEIKHRPRRTWFQSSHDKEALRRRESEKDEAESLAADQGRAEARRRKLVHDQAKKKLGVSVRGKRAAAVVDDQGHRLTRKKRRRQQALLAEEEEDAGRSQAAVLRHAKQAKRKDRPSSSRDNDLVVPPAGEKKKKAKKKSEDGATNKTAFADVDAEPAVADRAAPRRNFTDFDPNKVGLRKNKHINATGSFKSKARYKRR